VWVTTARLHSHSPKLTQRWRQVQAGGVATAVAEALSDLAPGQRALVFANSAESATDLHADLLSVGLACDAYHSAIPPLRRNAALAAFRAGAALRARDSDALRAALPASCAPWVRTAEPVARPSPLQVGRRCWCARMLQRAGWMCREWRTWFRRSLH